MIVLEIVGLNSCKTSVMVIAPTDCIMIWLLLIISASGGHPVLSVYISSAYLAHQLQKLLLWSSSRAENFAVFSVRNINEVDRLWDY